MLDLEKPACPRALLSPATLLVATACLAFAAPASAGLRADLTLSGGQVRIHAPTTSQASGACTAALFGVGSGLTRGNYNSLGDQMTAQAFVFVVLDHAPGDAFGKADAGRYAALAREIKGRLVGDLAALGSGCTSIARYLIGGHSASGQAAHSAAIADPSLGVGIFSADPYDLAGLGNLSLPGLYWGFEQTTCFADKNKAAKAGYYRTPSPGRALHRVPYRACGFLWPPPKYHHMSFIDPGLDLGSLGCMAGCATPSSFYRDVAVSVRRFVDARWGTLGWSKANLQVPAATTPITLYVDGDAP